MNKKLIIVTVLVLVAVLLVLFCPSIGLMIPFSIISILLCIGSLVLNQIVRKDLGEKKGFSTLLNIFSILVLLFCLVELLGSILMTNPDMNEPICQREDMVSDCVDNEKGVSTCKYMKSVDIPCNNDVLEDNQLK